MFLDVVSNDESREYLKENQRAENDKYDQKNHQHQLQLNDPPAAVWAVELAPVVTVVVGYIDTE